MNDREGCGCGYLGWSFFIFFSAMAFGLRFTDTILTETTLPFLDLTQSDICIIQANHAEVAIHVGPGRQRSQYALMPVDRPFEASGQATVTDLWSGDEQLWWRIADRDTLFNLTEGWVNAADVTATGNCTQIPEVEAPPIVVPIVPTATNSPTSTPEEPVNNNVQQSVATAIPTAPTSLTNTPEATVDVPSPEPIITPEVTDMPYYCDPWPECDDMD